MHVYSFPMQLEITVFNDFFGFSFFSIISFSSLLVVD